MAEQIIAILQLDRVSGSTNEVVWKDGRAVVKCCGPRTGSIGVTATMLNRLNAVLAALQQRNGDVEIIELSIADFKANMSESRSTGHDVGKVKKVSRSCIRNLGKGVCTITAAEIGALG